MNSINFINEKLKETEQRIRHWEMQLKNYPDEEVLTKCLNSCKKELAHFQQIKSELEAWEVCKKNYHINKYEELNKGRDKKRFDISIWLNTENCDFKSCASYEDILKVKKALEVEDNVD